MKVAVTGGTGFVGRHLVLRCLREGWHVRVLSRSPRRFDEWPFYDQIEWHRGDVTDKESLSGFLDGVDVLYHCAGQLTDTQKMREVHLDGTSNLISMAAGRIDHWVQLSSVGVYGPVSSGTVTEQTPLNPVGEYEITKAESDKLVLRAANEGKFTLSILRPSIIFGVDMVNRSLLSMIAMIERGFFFFIGRSGASANYIHVDNVVRALFVCGVSDKARNKIFNLSDWMTIESFVETISKALGCATPRLRVPESIAHCVAYGLGWIPGFPLTESRVRALTGRAIYSSGLIHNVGYEPGLSMEAGIAELVEGYVAGRTR